MRMHDFQTSERPRERCLEHGAQSLSLRECLAALLGAGPPGLGALGVADELLKSLTESEEQDAREAAFFNCVNLSSNLVPKRIKGIGDAGIVRILVCMELARRYAEHLNNSSQPPKGNDLDNRLYDLIPRQLCHDSREWIGFIPIDRSLRAEPLQIVAKGLQTQVNFDISRFFAQVLAWRPAAILVVHNHPSGSLHPSQQDLDLTDRLTRLLEQFSIRLYGHWIVSSIGRSKIKIS